MRKIAVFASEIGEDFEYLIKSVNNRMLDCSIELLVCDSSTSYVAQLASSNNIEAFTYNNNEKSLIKKLSEKDVKLLVLTNFQGSLGTDTTIIYKDNLIRLSPSLLPHYEGANPIQRAIEYGIELQGNEIVSEIENLVNARDHEHYAKILNEKLDDLEK